MIGWNSRPYKYERNEHLSIENLVHLSAWILNYKDTHSGDGVDLAIYKLKLSSSLLLVFEQASKKCVNYRAHKTKIALLKKWSLTCKR